MIIKTCFFAFLLCLYGCAPLFYDPVYEGDVPSCPASAWENSSFLVKETAERPYTAADLSGDMTLSRLLDIALNNNPITRVSWNTARASAYAFEASLSEFYPTIVYAGELSAQTSRGSSFANSSAGIVTSGTTTATSGTESKLTTISNELTLTYLLLDFGGRIANSELAKQILIASNWQHNVAMQQVMLSVLNAYVAYIGNMGLVKAYEQNLKDAEVAVKASKAMHGAGLATITDVMLAQSNLEQTKTNLAQAIGAEKTAKSELLIALGLPADTDISVENLPQELPVIEISGNISSLLELAKKRRPDLGIAIAAIKQQEAQLAIAYSNSMPILTANANWNQIRFLSPRKPSGYNETAFLEVNFPIFQGFFYLNQQRQLRAQIEEALANLDVQVAAVSTQVAANYYSYTSAEAALPSSEAAVAYSQRAYQGYVVQYKTGTASILDVLTSLTLLSNARAQLVLTRTQWAGSLANLAFAVGILDENAGHWGKAPSKETSKSPKSDDHANDK